MPEMGTSGLMSGDGKRGGARASVPAPVLDSTKCRKDFGWGRAQHYFQEMFEWDWTFRSASAIVCWMAL